MRKFVFLMGFLCIASAKAQTTMVFEPSKDNTIYAENNSRSNGAGQNLFVGVTQGQIGNQERRALLAFDVSAIPAGSTVTNVELQVRVTKTRAGSVNVSAHEVTADWGEGTSSAGARDGGGAPAATGDATWQFRSFNGTSWNNLGGDFAGAALTSTAISSGNATFPSSTALVGLVQSWVDGGDNFGVILRAATGSTPSTKRLASRQNNSSDQRPKLSVTFTAGAPMTEVPISGLWFDDDAPGDGYNVIQSVGGVLTVFFFGYSASGERLWLVTESPAIGPILTNQGITLEVFEATGGVFGDPTSELQSWGTLTITVTSCETATFVLSGTDGEKTSDVVKLANLEGITCTNP